MQFKKTNIYTAIVSLAFFLTVLPLRSEDGFDALFMLTKEERMVLICKMYETMHRECGSTIGYGHVIQSGEPYSPNQELSECEADALLRTDLDKLLAIFERYGEYRYILAALSYNVGVGKIMGCSVYPKSELLRNIENREPKEKIKNIYFQYRNAWGRPIRRLYLRRLVEWKLLVD